MSCQLLGDSNAATYSGSTDLIAEASSYGAFLLCVRWALIAVVKNTFITPGVAAREGCCKLSSNETELGQLRG